MQRTRASTELAARISDVMRVLWPLVEDPQHPGATPVERAYGLLTRLRSDAADGAFEPHVQGPVECRVCGHRWQAVVHMMTGLADLECPNCGEMAGDAIGDEDEGSDT